MVQLTGNFCKFSIENERKIHVDHFCFVCRPNDEIINVNGHPVIRSMENTALKLIRESTDFVNLVIRRRKTPVVVSDSQPPIKFVLNKTRKDEKFGLVLGCRYFIKRIHLNNNSEMLNDLHEGDEILKVWKNNFQLKSIDSNFSF